MTTPEVNVWGQPLSWSIPGWEPRPRPAARTLVGHHCRLEALDVARHAEDLFRANSTDDGRMWTYLAYGPFPTVADYRSWMERFVGDETTVAFAVVDSASGRALGVAAYLRITPEHGVIEVGHLAFSPGLQRTVGATEAMALMMRYVFEDLGYRRYEWKCHALNAGSRRAATRLGFTYEGTFRQSVVVKGRNRDTAWFAMTDGDWTVLRDVYAVWLEPANFDGEGQQRQALSSLTAGALLDRDRHDGVVSLPPRE
jgi:RimJ/RimL family protein N-acetyltransferase